MPNDTGKLIGKGKFSVTPQEDFIQTDDDADINKKLKSNAVENSSQYKKILQIYVENAHSNLKRKKLFKLIFFWMSIAILAITLIAFVGVLIFAIVSDSQISEKLTIVISALVSLVAPLLVLPQKIAQYLFTTTDEEDMKEILKTIIQHDENILK